MEIPKPPNPLGQAKLILESNGLRAIQPKFFSLDNKELAIEQSQIADKQSWMGTPMFDIFRFNGGFSYTNDQGVKVNIEVAITLDYCLLTVNQTKNIIVTPIQGAPGTVKEYIGMGDYQITVTGMIINRAANAPAIGLGGENTLQEYLLAPIPLSVSCNFLDFFGINTVVVQSFKIGQVTGARNSVDFSMELLSDTDPVFQIKTNAKTSSPTQGVPSF